MVMMSEWEGTAWAGTDVQTRVDYVPDSLADFTARMSGLREYPWRLPSIDDALGVPGIQRCVTLISNTTGSLVLQAYRNNALMADTPQIIQRPDPYSTPRDFYRDSAYNMATRGECVWWIAGVDSDGWPNALIVVPLRELVITPNERNRLFPTYEWGKFSGTRWSPAHRSGRFVHITYLKEPGALRGKGPLQMGKAAVSVQVEAQEWAANFYADGGNPSLVIKHSGQLSGARRLDPVTGEESTDDDAISEAELLRRDWMSKDHNTPRVIDQTIESVEYMTPANPAAVGALEARDFGNGDAARLYGMPGALLEYGVPGSSLTYQNLADVWTNFVRGCLAPNYLEPIEQSMADILPRSTNTRFLTSGLQRADEKSRWEIYQLMVAVLGAQEAAEIARVREDIAPGNPETAPVAYAPPTAVPASLPETRAESRDVRCDGMRTRRQNGVSRIVPCNALLSTTGVFVGPCPKCHKAHAVGIAA